jgi:hypothetical protein
VPLIGDISGSAGKDSRIGITGSVVFAGADTDYASSFPDIGTDVAFYVSGAVGRKDSTTQASVAVFGGDLVVSGALDVGSSTAAKPTSTALNVYANVSSDYVVKIDNDQNTSGHVLKLITDGNGSGSRFLEMEDGDGDVLFMARADGRFGFGATGVSSMGAGTFVVGIDGGHTSDIAISKRLQHLGDSDTYMDFTAADQIEFVAGGVDFIHMTEDGSQDVIVFNEGGADVDFRVESNTKTHAVFVDAGTDQVLVLSGGNANSPNESAYPDTNFFVSGTIDSMGSATKGTSVFGGDLVVSGGIKVPNKSSTTVNLGATNNDGGNGVDVTQNTRSGVITVTLGAEMADNGSGFFNLYSSQLAETDVIVTTTAGTSTAAGGDHQVYLKIRPTSVQDDYYTAGSPGCEIFIQNETGGAIASGQTVKFNWAAI